MTKMFRHLLALNGGKPPSFPPVRPRYDYKSERIEFHLLDEYLNGQAVRGWRVHTLIHHGDCAWVLFERQLANA